VTVTARREAVQLLVARGLSQRRACVLLQLQRSTFGYQARPERDAELTSQVDELARRHPRYEYRRVWALLRRRGQCMNLKHVHRLWKRAKLQVRKVRRKRGLARPATVPVQATHPGHVWTYDFLHDRCLFASGKGMGQGRRTSAASRTSIDAARLPLASALFSRLPRSQARRSSGSAPAILLAETSPRLPPWNGPSIAMVTAGLPASCPCAMTTPSSDWGTIPAAEAREIPRDATGQAARGSDRDQEAPGRTRAPATQVAG
jgi:HTH-like domain